MEQNKDHKQLSFLYDWMKIARRHNQSLTADIKMLFQLISIPISQSQIKIIEKYIDPEGKKTELSKQDLIHCFLMEQECKKPKQKEIVKAFKYISSEEENISFDQLKKYFYQQEIDPSTTQMILKQLGQYENSKGTFDYKKFAANLY